MRNAITVFLICVVGIAAMTAAIVLGGPAVIHAWHAIDPAIRAIIGPAIVLGIAAAIGLIWLHRVSVRNALLNLSDELSELEAELRRSPKDADLKADRRRIARQMARLAGEVEVHVGRLERRVRGSRRNWRGGDSDS